jgi:DNA invertase Pin-like site-specific DNA recombinase
MCFSYWRFADHSQQLKGASMSKRVAFYVRVSTDGQTVENQLGELHAVAKRHGWQVAQTYADRGISGTKGRDGRPEFDKLLKAINRRDVDMVAAWSVDRLGRSLQDLVGLLSELQAKGVDLFLLQQGLDTSTPSGRAMFQMLGVFSEFEAAMIRERVRTGITRAKRSGTKSGRPIGRPRLPADMEIAAQKLLRDGIGILKVARTLKIGTGTVSKISAQLRNDLKPGRSGQ